MPLHYRYTPAGHWYFLLLSYIIVCFTMIGLQEIAVAMSDPFGDDDTDFDTTRLLEKCYNNVLEYYTEQHLVDDATADQPASDSHLVFRRNKRFASFGVDIHGDTSDSVDQLGALASELEAGIEQ